MHIQSIVQEAIHLPRDSANADSDRVVTVAVITHVASHCILARQLITVLGKPPTHSNLEILGSGDTWTIAWSHPQLTLEAATAALHQALSPTQLEAHP